MVPYQDISPIYLHYCCTAMLYYSDICWIQLSCSPSCIGWQRTCIKCAHVLFMPFAWDTSTNISALAMPQWYVEYRNHGKQVLITLDAKWKCFHMNTITNASISTTIINTENVDIICCRLIGASSWSASGGNRVNIGSTFGVSVGLHVLSWA